MEIKAERLLRHRLQNSALIGRAVLDDFGGNGLEVGSAKGP
jgi:hypothetical protein